MGYRTAREGREDAHRLSAEARAAASDEARATRLFDARRSDYVDVMDYVYLINYAHRTEPLVSFSNDPPPPPFPPEEEERRQTAAVAAFGSPSIWAKLTEFKRAVQEIHGSVFGLRSFRQSFGEHSNEVLKRWQEVEEKRQAVRASVLELIELVNADLAR